MTLASAAHLDPRSTPQAGAAVVTVSSDKAFLWRVCMSAWLLRFVIIVLMQLTDAIGRLRLSPDSERYHREGFWIMQDMKFGHFDWPNWIDNGWFQFTGFVYWLLWPSPFLMQLLNITFSTLTVIPLFLVMRQLTPDIRAQRFYALLIAFFPSFIYWSTLMLKDPVSILALALIVYGVTMLRLRFKMTDLLLVLAGLLIYVGTRTYLFVVVVMLAPFAFMLFPLRQALGSPRAIILSVILGALPVIFGLGYFASGAFQDSIYFDLDYINKVRTSMGDHGSGALFDTGEVHVWGKDPVGDLLAIGRTALAVFIPVNPFDVGSVRQLIALPLVGVMFYVLYLFVPGARMLWRRRRIAAPVIIFGLAVLAVYIAGTTNAGALFRWTTQVMPYILIAATLGLFARRRRLERWATRVVMSFSRARRRVAPQAAPAAPEPF